MQFIPFHEYRQLVYKAFFKGRSLLEETQCWQTNEIASFLVKANLWTLLFAELIVLLVKAISQTGWFYFDVLYAALGVGLGVIGGMGWGLAWEVSWGVVWSWALGLGIGAAMGLESHYAWYWVWGISMGSMLGAAISTTAGFNMGLFGGIVTAAVSGLVSSFILGKTGGAAWGLSFLIVYFFTWNRWIYLPFFLFALIKKVKPGYLPTHWDENIHAPIPGLKTILVRMAFKEAGEDGVGRQEAMNEAVFLAQTRPAQRHAAQEALVEIVASEMVNFKEIDDIANLRQTLNFPSNDTGVLPQSFFRGFENLLEFSEQTLMILKNPDLSESLKDLESLTLQVMRFKKKMDTGKSGTDRQFLKIATVWLEIMERASKSLEEKTASLLPNPFIVGKPLKPGSDLFVGREALIKDIQRVAVQIRTVGAIVLLGSPQIGKSSLLLNLKQYIQPDIKTVYIDFKDKIASESLHFFCKTTAKSVHRAIGRQTKFTMMCATLTDLCEYLRAVQSELEENNFRLLLCFDHYEKLTEKIVMRDFVGFPKALRFWIQRLHRTTVLIAGTQSPEQITQVDWNQHLGNFRVIPVRTLDTKSALKLATLPAAGIGLKYAFGTEGLNKFVLRLGCHPFLIQAALSELIIHLNIVGKKEADTEDIDKAIINLLTSANRFFESIWYKEITEPERTLLSSIAHNQSIPRSAYATVDSLTRKAILRVGDNGYSFRIPLFQEWVTERVIQ
jgi:hypothetical protein